MKKPVTRNWDILHVSLAEKKEGVAKYRTSRAFNFL